MGMRKPRPTFLATALLAVVCVIGWVMRHPSPVDPAHRAVATLSGGCFWGLQESLRSLPGVTKTTVGYTGGTTTNPTHDRVASRKTGHTEAVEVVFDPTRLSYEDLLTAFLNARDPARLTGSTNSTARSAIFYHDEGQRLTAERAKDRGDRSGKWSSPVVAEVTAATAFYPAEEYHQDYYLKMSAARACSSE
jgi:methionine-S-sulfoxide reductase